MNLSGGLLSKLNYLFFYSLLIAPLLSIIYSLGLGLPKTILNAYSLYIFLYGIFFIVLKKKLNFPNYFFILLVYAIYRLTWSIIAFDETREFLTSFYYSTYQFSILFILVIIYNTHITDRFIQISIRVLKYTILIAFIVSIIQMVNYSFLNYYQFRGVNDFGASFYTQRRFSIFGFLNADSIGFTFIPLSAILLSYMIKYHENNPWAFSILVAFVAFFSNVRYVMSGFVITMLIYLINEKNFVKGVFKFMFLSAALVIGGYYFLIYALNFNFIDFYYERFMYKGTIEQSTRWQAFYTFSVFYPRAPIFGIGTAYNDEIAMASREIAQSSRIHVGYLSQLVAYGIVGATLLWSFWYYLAKSLLKTARKNQFWGSFVAFLVFLWGHALYVQDSIFFYGLLLAFIFDKYYKQETLRKTN